MYYMGGNLNITYLNYLFVNVLYSVKLKKHSFQTIYL